MEKHFKNGYMVETCESWDVPGFYDIYISKDGEVIDMDFARGQDEKELINEAENIIHGFIDSEVTKVIFRKFRDGQIIALFPEDRNGGFVGSYMHDGQHGDADPFIVYSTKLATPEEYAPLKKELEGIGYVLDVRKRMQHR